MFVYLLMLLQLDPLGEKAFSDFMEIQGARVREVASQFVHTFNFTFKGLFLSYAFRKFLIISKGSKSDFIIELAPMCGTKVANVVVG